MRDPFKLDAEDIPDGPCPPAPPWHVDSPACLHGWIGESRTLGMPADETVINKPAWLLCDCEDPANPWPARQPTDGPRDCACAICHGHEPRSERGRLDGCENRDHHCDSCHGRRLCTTTECAFTKSIQ